MENRIPDLSEYNFNLPEEKIARYPSSERDLSRLMILSLKDNLINSDERFKSIISYLHKGDLLIFNHTKVSKRRVYLHVESGRTHETMFLEPVTREDTRIWKCLIKVFKKIKLQEKLYNDSGDLTFIVIDKSDGFVFLEASEYISEEIFERIGNIPIPPYFKRKAEKQDEIRYQTIFAKEPGSVAAPTAGLHFTDTLKSALSDKGIILAPVNLNVGYGTFSPLTEEQLKKRKLHEEHYSIPEETALLLNRAKKEGNRIIAVGTTSLRVLESSYNSEIREFKSGNGVTDIFIYPGIEVESIQGLITNFHLPMSSLLLLVAAFAGKDLVIRAYQEAIEKDFRFFSYGDAMLIV